MQQQTGLDANISWMDCGCFLETSCPDPWPAPSLYVSAQILPINKPHPGPEHTGRLSVPLICILPRILITTWLITRTFVSLSLGGTQYFEVGALSVLLPSHPSYGTFSKCSSD